MKKYLLRQNSKESAADLFIYGDIGEDFFAEESVDAKTIVDELHEIEADTINVRIATHGGVLSDAVAMFNALLRKDARIVTHNDSVAHSAGSLLMMAGDERIMAENATTMIHGPSACAMGTAGDMRQLADRLDIMAESIVPSYLRSGKVDEANIREWLFSGEDHLFTAQQSLELGLVDRLAEPLAAAASAKAWKKIINSPVAAGKRKPEVIIMPNKDEGQPTGSIDAELDTDPHQAYLQGHRSAVEKGRTLGEKAAHKRIISIQKMFADFTLDPLDDFSVLMAACVDDQACDVNMAQARLLELFKVQTDMPIAAADPDRKVRPQREQRMEHGEDQQDKFVAGATKALMVKHNVERDPKKRSEESSSEYLSFSLTDLCKESLRVAGVKPQGTKEDIVRKVVMGGPGQGTDHFSSILENIANKTVMDGFTEAPERWSEWTIEGVLNDYRPASRVNKSLFDKLDLMKEHAQFRHGRFADVKQSITGFLHGKEFSLTLQAIVNDDLSLLTEDARAWGEAASVTIGDSVFTVLTAAGTGGYGQTMDEDSQILFHVDHSNFIDTGSGGAPAKATIAAGRTAMMTQADPNSRTVANMPRYLLHGTTNTLDLFELLNSQSYSSSTAAVQGERNAVASLQLQEIEDYRFDDTAISPAATAWILAAARRTVEVSFVGGQRTPRVDRMATSSIPGVSWQISIPFGVAALDYRAFYFNFGA